MPEQIISDLQSWDPGFFSFAKLLDTPIVINTRSHCSLWPREEEHDCIGCQILPCGPFWVMTETRDFGLILQREESPPRVPCIAVLEQGHIGQISSTSGGERTALKSELPHLHMDTQSAWVLWKVNLSGKIQSTPSNLNSRQTVHNCFNLNTKHYVRFTHAKNQSLSEIQIYLQILFRFTKFVSIHYGCSPQLPSVCVLKVDAKRKESYYTKQYSFHFLNRTSTLL